MRQPMLNLLEPTSEAWVQSVQKDLPRLLSDHAHCELKAAQSALSLVARFGGEAPEIVEPLTALAKEETEHFAQVHEKLSAYGATLPPPPIDAYVRALQSAARSDKTAAPLLLDRLLVAALIEARSCERFSLLAENLPDADLQAFYRDLMKSEARHYRLFSRLAEELFGKEVAQDRLAVLAKREATVAAQLPLGATVHG